MEAVKIGGDLGSTLAINFDIKEHKYSLIHHNLITKLLIEQD